MLPYSMLQHVEDFVGPAFDTSEGACDGSRWRYINTWALSWSRERGEKWSYPASCNANSTNIYKHLNTSKYNLIHLKTFKMG
jgi:hypothetical protein